MTVSGRCGEITYEEDGRSVRLYWEMSGSPSYDILLCPLNLNYWDTPERARIADEKQLEILQALRRYLTYENLKSDIAIPPNTGESDKECMWTQCESWKLSDFAYCREHYDRCLLRKDHAGANE